MGLGVLGKGLHVPGTIPGFFDCNHSLERADLEQSHLKFDRSGKIPILLVPQPSDDPRDPLNLPLWRRDLNLFVLCLIGILSVCLSSIMASNSIVVLVDLQIAAYADVAGLTGYHLLAVGLGGFVWVSTARVWGKRHVYMCGILLVIAGSAWAGSVQNGKAGYGSLLGARILQGIGVAPFEALINASVADLFFVHERGWRMALSNMSIFGGAFFTPVIAGVITIDMSWQWTFKWVAIITGALFPFFFFFCFESTWPRAVDAETAHLHLPVGESTSTTSAESSAPDASVADKSKETGYDMCSVTPTNTTTDTPAPSATSAWSFWTSLHIFSGRKSDESFLKIFIRPLPLFLNPGILWACLAQGCMIGWTVFIGLILATLFYGPPSNFGPEQIGFLYTGACIGSIAAFVFCGMVQDPLTRLLTRLNQGVFEPEFRLPAIALLQLVTGIIGLFGFGLTASNQYRWGYLIPDMFFAFQVASMVCGAVVSATYIAEAHRDVAIEGFTCLLIFKNVFTYAIATQGVPWLLQSGPEHIFIIIGIVQACVASLALPMYLFGKQNRRLTANVDMLRILHLR